MLQFDTAWAYHFDTSCGVPNWFTLTKGDCMFAYLARFLKSDAAKNEALARFLALKQEIARLTKEQDAIKSQIEAAGGSFQTSEFRVETSQVETNRVVDCETLLFKVGIVRCAELGLIVQGTRKNLKVERKEKLAA